MHIEFSKLHLTPHQNLSRNKKQNAPQNSVGSTSYNPLYYQDYNISFNARLFRTPANFFEQDFNRNGMPETMKNYLFADYEDRQNMPPNQMLKLVFEDINETKSLEQVKSIYPEEVLFENLRETPNRKVRTGVIAEIDLMKDEGLSLFKDKDESLGLYILKKIYLEGKTLKEINKDFQNDITDDFKGLSPIDYKTLAAYGIKYPQMSFWKSFIATREDFPYEYKPRKAVESRVQREEPKEISLSGIKKEFPQLQQKKRFDGIKDWEIDRLTDVVINGNGSVDETRKYMKKRNIKPNENSSFVFKYSSPIMSVALEKIHASDEMKEFYENYNSSTKSQRERMEAYWKNNPQANALRSMAMKDTIKLFMDAYGVDGNNEEFKDLLLYAESIKPARIEQEKEHNRIQTEYDEMFANLNAEDMTNSVPDSQNDKPIISEEEMNAMLEAEAVKNGASVFTFESPDGANLKYVVNVNEEFENNLRDEVKLLPTRFQNRYLNFMLKSPLATDEYKKSIVLISKVPEFVREQLMEPEEYRAISSEINKQFQMKYPQVLLANDQALAERLLARLGKDEKYARMMEFDTSTMLNFANDTLHISEWSPQEYSQLQRDYETYITPVDRKEDINKINQEMVSYIAALNTEEQSDFKDSLTDEFIKLISANMKKYPQIKNMLSKVIRQTKFVEAYGGTSKILLKPDASNAVKETKSKLMMEDLIRRNSSELLPLFAADIDNINKYLTDEAFASLLIEKAISMRKK